MNIPALIFGSALVLVTLNVSNAAMHSNTAKTKHVNDIRNQQARSIQQGINLGKLTPRETRKLKKEQREIKKLETLMKEDGVITSSELSILFEKLEKSRKHISRLTRNSISTSAKVVSLTDNKPNTSKPNELPFD